MFVNLSLISTELLLCVLILVVLGWDILAKASERYLAYVSIAGLSGLAVWLIYSTPQAMGTTFGGQFLQDSLAVYFKLFFIITTILVIFMVHKTEYEGLSPSRLGEFYLLILTAALGMMLLVSAGDFLFFYISLELITVSFYILTAYLKKEHQGTEAGLKYLILSSLASGLLVYGICYIYGSTGSTHFQEIRVFLEAHQSLPPWFLGGMVLVLAGLAFKISAVPFHLWVPDVYEGSPTPVTAFLAVGSKAAGFAALLRILLTVFWKERGYWMIILSCLAALNLLYGNLAAIPQKNIKRLLAYSSIGHAGYLLMGVASGSELGMAGVAFYLLAYLFTILAAFLVIVIVSNALKSDLISDYRGLSKRSPFLAAVLFLALLSSAGVPPLGGFFGKFLVLLAAVKSGLAPLALLGAVMVVVALYYYLLIIKAMYMDSPPSDSSGPIVVPSSARWVLLGCSASILLMGIFQGPFVNLASAAVRSLF